MPTYTLVWVITDATPVYNYTLTFVFNRNELSRFDDKNTLGFWEFREVLFSDVAFMIVKINWQIPASQDYWTQILILEICIF